MVVGSPCQQPLPQAPQLSVSLQPWRPQQPRLRPRQPRPPRPPPRLRRQPQARQSYSSPWMVGLIGFAEEPLPQIMLSHISPLRVSWLQEELVVHLQSCSVRTFQLYITTPQRCFIDTSKGVKFRGVLSGLSFFRWDGHLRSKVWTLSSSASNFAWPPVLAKGLSISTPDVKSGHDQRALVLDLGASCQSSSFPASASLGGGFKDS